MYYFYGIEITVTLILNWFTLIYFIYAVQQLIYHSKKGYAGMCTYIILSVWFQLPETQFLLFVTSIRLAHDRIVHAVYFMQLLWYGLLCSYARDRPYLMVSASCNTAPKSLPIGICKTHIKCSLSEQWIII